MFYPKMESLLKPTVWLDAANQVNKSNRRVFLSGQKYLTLLVQEDIRDV